MITISCPACSKRYLVDESRCGKKLKCQCGNIFRASSAPLSDFSSASKLFVKPEANPPQLASAASDPAETIVAKSDSPQPNPAAPDQNAVDDLQLAPLSPPATHAPPPSPTQTIGGTNNRNPAVAAPSPRAERAATPQKSRIYFGIENNLAFKAGQTLAWVGFLGLNLPRMGMQLVMLSLSVSPYQVRVMAIVAMIVGAVLLFFSQGKDFIRGGAMALFVLVLLGGILGLDYLQADGLIEKPHSPLAVQPQIQLPPPQIQPQQMRQPQPQVQL